NEFAKADGGWDTLVSQLKTGSGNTYFPIAPVRVMDSRINRGITGALPNNVSRTFAVAGTMGIPTNATAITGNLTVVGQTAPGYVALTVSPTTSPSTSTLNFPLGDSRANGVSVKLTTTGSLWAVYKTSGFRTAHVIFDVTGYYVPGTGGLSFFPLNPGRRLDGRPSVNLGLPGPFAASVARTLDVDGHVGVPVGAKAIT